MGDDMLELQQELFYEPSSLDASSSFIHTKCSFRYTCLDDHANYDDNYYDYYNYNACQARQ